jgi:hypothetical protein
MSEKVRFFIFIETLLSFYFSNFRFRVLLSFLHRFACSVSVTNVPGMLKEKELVLQGNYPSEVEQYLLQTYQVPRQVIELPPSQKGGKKIAGGKR